MVSSVTLTKNMKAQYAIALAAFFALCGPAFAGQVPNPANISGAVTTGHTIISNGGQNFIDGGAPGISSITGDCTSTGSVSIVITCLKTNGTPFTSAATTSIGTSGATIPLLSTANTWSLGQTMPTATLGAGAGANLNSSTCTLPSAGCSWLYESDFVFGKNTGSRPQLHFLSTTDQMWAAGSAQLADDWAFFANVGGGTFNGNRNAVSSIIQIAASPAMPTLGNQVASFSRANYQNGTYGTGYGGVNTPGAYSQNGWAHNGVVLLGTNVKNAQNVWGDEEDLDTQQPVVSKVGFQATILSDGTQYQGLFNDTAFDVVNQSSAAVGWLCGFCLGAPAGSWAIDTSNGTLVGAQPRTYSGTETVGALFGIDFRPVTFAANGDALALPNMAVAPDGGVHASTINSTGMIRGEAATVSALAIVADSDGISGGLYTSAPTITISAPPSGVTATASPATYTLGRIVGYASTGSGYTVNDILTGVGGSGTQPTYKVTGVDANGGVTTCSVNSVGALTALPTTTVTYPTGGTGTHAGFYITYGASGPTACTPGVTGKNYIVGDTLTHTGTGTPGILTVDTVDAFGGVLTAHVSTAGNLTVPPFPSTAVLVSGGTGTGANLALGFSIATTTLSGGSGYVNEAPIVTTTQSTYRNARFKPTMTASETALSVNPGGQLVSVGGALKTGGYTVGTLPSATIGTRTYVTDATACTFGSAPTGGAATFCPVIYTGAGWIEG